MFDATPIIAVDVGSLAYRSHYAMQGLAHEGQPTSILHGFLLALLKLQKVSPRLVFCFDYGTPDQGYAEPWRKLIYPAYKANRKATPDIEKVKAQLPHLHQALKILGYQCIGVPGLEADDLLGILSRRHQDNFLLYSHDSDLYQLLEKERVCVLHRDKEWKVITQAAIEKQFGFPVSRWAVYLALGGDKSDNIRPLPRCGEKGAMALVTAGADPRKPFEDQPSCIQREEFAEAWRMGTVKHAYQVTHIPRKVTDWRVQDYIHKHPITISLDRSMLLTDERIDLFVQFCSRFGLLDCIAHRYQFFETARQESGTSRHRQVSGKQVLAKASHARPVGVRP